LGIIRRDFVSILAMKIVKILMDFFFTIVLSVFLVFILINIAYTKREEVKQEILNKLLFLKLSLRELYHQGNSKVLEYKLAYKNNKIT